MSHQPLSQLRIALLLVVSTIAGLVVSSWLSTRVETRQSKPLPRTDHSLAVENP